MSTLKGRLGYALREAIIELRYKVLRAAEWVNERCFDAIIAIDRNQDVRRELERHGRIKAKGGGK